LQAQAGVVRCIAQRLLDAGVSLFGIAEVLVDLRFDQNRLVVVGVECQHFPHPCERELVFIDTLQEYRARDQHIDFVSRTQCLELGEHLAALARRKLERACCDNREIAGAAGIVRRPHVGEGLPRPAGAGEFGGRGELGFGFFRLRRGPQQGGLEGGAVRSEVAGHAGGACRDPGVVGTCCLLQIVAQRHVEHAPACREFRHQQCVQRILGKRSVSGFGACRQRFGGGDYCRHRLRSTAAGDHDARQHNAGSNACEAAGRGEKAMEVRYAHGSRNVSPTRRKRSILHNLSAN